MTATCPDCGRPHASPSCDATLDTFVPDLWLEQVRRDLNRELLWNTKYAHLPYAQLPIPPLRKRLWRAIKWATDRRREWLALKIAPWLEPEDGW